jgi:hypothetical protein
MTEIQKTFKKIVRQLDPQKRENLSGDITNVANALEGHTEPRFSLTFSTENGLVTTVNALWKTNFTDGKSAIAFVNNRKPGSVFGKIVANAVDL